jgi:hypothetical protein
LNTKKKKAQKCAQSDAFSLARSVKRLTFIQMSRDKISTDKVQWKVLCFFERHMGREQDDQTTRKRVEKEVFIFVTQNELINVKKEN